MGLFWSSGRKVEGRGPGFLILDADVIFGRPLKGVQGVRGGSEDEGFFCEIEIYGVATRKIHTKILTKNTKIVTGEAEFQPDFFPNPRTLFDTLRAKQMTPRLMLHPFMAANTTAYNLLMRDPATRRYLVASQTSAVPATDVTWWMDRHAAMLDLTKSAAVKWHRDRTRELLSAHGLHGCWFLGGASGWPKNGTVDGKFSRDLQARFADSAAEICGDSVVGETSGRFDRKIVRIADDTWEVGRSSEESLQRQLKSVIPTALTASLLGHPVFVTSMIGGNPFVGADGQLDFQNAGIHHETNNFDQL